MFFTPIAAVAFLATSGFNPYYIDPASVDLADRTQWCLTQTATCSVLCSGAAGTDNCSIDLLTFNCICTANGSAPGLQYYKGTILTNICERNFENCVSRADGDPQYLDKCTADKVAYCGQLDPLSFPIVTPRDYSSNSSSNGTTTASLSSPTDTTLSSTSDGTASTSSSSPTDTTVSSPSSTASTSTVTLPQNSQQKPHRISSGAIAGIVVAIVILITASSTAIFFYYRRKSKKNTHIELEHQYPAVAELPQGRHYEKTELEVKDQGIVGFRAELSGEGNPGKVADVQKGSQLNLTREVANGGSMEKNRS